MACSLFVFVKEMTKDEKRPFVEMAEEDKIRYEGEVGADPNHQPSLRGKGKKMGKVANAPKPPLSSYNFFAKEMFGEVKEANPGTSFAQRSRIIGKLWRDATTSQKLRFVQLGMLEKARYQAVRIPGILINILIKNCVLLFLQLFPKGDGHLQSYRIQTSSSNFI